MTADIVGIAAGLLLLILGAEALVRGAVSMAGRAHVPPLIIGLTVVAFGTSTPEVAVAVGAAVEGGQAVSLGNVLGSNIFNILVILGISAVVAPLVVRVRVVRVDAPLMLGAAILPMLLALDGRLGLVDGVVLVTGMAAYLVILGVLAGRERTRTGMGDYRVLGWPASLVLLLVGFVLLGFGADWLVVGATGLARMLGVDEVVIGLTVVAAGTSLPELATSIAATARNQRDLAVGNVLGSNIFNVLGVLGVGATLSGDIPVEPGVLMLDFPVMIAVSVACLPVFLTGAVINRLEGGLFLAYYVLYITYLGLHATDHALQDEFGILVLGVVLPLTLAVAGALWVRAGAQEREEGAVEASEPESRDAAASD